MSDESVIVTPIVQIVETLKPLIEQYAPKASQELIDNLYAAMAALLRAHTLELTESTLESLRVPIPTWSEPKP